MRKVRTDGSFCAGIYLRLSREDENTLQSESIGNQKEFLTSYVIEQGWILEDCYIDDGYTGTNFDRPGFKRLLKDIENGRINIVVTKDLSRLGRDYISTGYYLEKYFPQQRVRYIAVSDGIDTFEDSSSNNDMSPFRSVINDMYARDISKKVRSVMDTKRRNGKFIGAFAPYGYKKDPDNRNHLVIDEETAPVVRKIFNLYIEGNGYSSISRLLDAEGILKPTRYKQLSTSYKSGNTVDSWGHETVRNILGNPTYAGHLAQGKYAVVSYKVRKLRTLSKDSWYVVKNTHEPIVSQDVFDRAQEMMAGKISYRTGAGYKHLLKGLVYCGDCGHRMTFALVHKSVWYLLCSNYKRFRGCTRHSIKEEDINKFVLDSLKNIARKTVDKTRLYAIAKKSSSKMPDDSDEQRLKKLEKRINEIKLSIKLLYDDRVKGIIDENTFTDVSRSYGDERKNIECQMEALQKKVKAQKSRKDRSDELLDLVESIASFDDVDNIILSELIEKIEVLENCKIKVYYKFRQPN
jgi:site-specific DNA recombinase